jgi:Flp pilus assembly pilin Flp
LHENEERKEGQNTMETASRFARDESGIQHAEDALLLAAFAVALVTATRTFGNAVFGAFTSAAATVAASI